MHEEPENSCTFACRHVLYASDLRIPADVQPDITGSFSPNFNGDSGGFHFSSGAIYSGCFNRGKKVDFSCGWDRYGDDYALNFAAHYSNNVYGNSSSVSVPAAYSLIIIRT